MLVCRFLAKSCFKSNILYLGRGWQEEGLGVRLAELLGFAEGSQARTAVALARMVGNFGAKNFGAGLENAIEVFTALDTEAQAGFLEALRALGSESGIDGLEALLDNFGGFLEQRAAEDFLMVTPTDLRYLEF